MSSSTNLTSILLGLKNNFTFLKELTVQMSKSYKQQLPILPYAQDIAGGRSPYSGGGRKCTEEA